MPRLRRACAWPLPTRGARRRDGRAPRALRAPPPRRAASDEEESDESYSDASEDARSALELRAAASSSEEDDSSSSDDDGPLRLRSTEAIADDGTDDALRARLENIEESDDDDDDALRLPGGFVLRASISSRLYAHQRRAVGWLWDLWRNREGGVVGDEMGLGKTAQVAAAFRCGGGQAGVPHVSCLGADDDARALAARIGELGATS